MDDYALFNITPNFCPDCGRPLDLIGPDFPVYRSGILHECPACGLSFRFVRDIEKIIRRLQDEEKEKQQIRCSSQED